MGGVSKKMRTYNRETALKKSVEYFKGNTIAADVFINKYALKNDKLELLESTPEQMHKRLVSEFVRVENKFPNPLSEEEISELITDFQYLIPGGSPMFGIGNPYQRVSLSNCFVIKTVDSYGGICRADERIAQISKRRGGVGIDISAIRPRGVSTRNSAFTTDGITVFMERFSNTSREVAQSGRRGALMQTISVHHPEILGFIRIKRDLQKVTGANISVRVTDEFMDAVVKDKKYELRWPVDCENPVISQKVNAREIWEELVKSNYMSAEPGILFWDNIIRNSPADCYSEEGFETISTNPCITGDTLVYVADGRGNIPIKELADKGEDVPVFCYDDKNKVTVRTMRNPRITGYKQPIYKVIFDDGNIIRATSNHKFLTTDLEYKRLDELEIGDSLKVLTRYEASIKDVFPKANSNSQDYFWVNNGFKSSQSEHRIIASHFYGEIEKKHIVHHMDYNAQNNNYANLKIMDKKEHDILHSEDILGDKNPMRRAQIEWSEEKWQDYRNKMSKATKGKNNGRYTGFTHEEVREHAIILTKQLGRRFSKKEWQKYARKNGLPIEFSEWRIKNISNLLSLSKWAAIKCDIEHIDTDPRLVKTLQLMLEQGYESFINGNQVFVVKECEECGGKFIKEHRQREVSFCSGFCANCYKDRHGVNNKRAETINKTYKVKAEKNKTEQLKIFTKLKFELDREPLYKEWENECRKNNVPFRLKTKYGFKNYKTLREESETFNHRIVSIELDGYEDVYNGTVDDFHNFFIGAFEGQTKNKKQKWQYLNSPQCGELPLCEGDSCRLMSMNLSAYVDNPFTEKASFNWKKFRSHIVKSQRLMDDLVEMEIESVKSIINKVKDDPEDKDTKANELALWETVLSKCKNGRRTGLGITALGDCMAMCNIKYGSEESIDMVEKIYCTLRNESYKSSVIMAKERGAFPIFDSKKERGHPYLSKLPASLRAEMNKVGRRNIGLLTTPPVGSGSQVTKMLDLYGTSSGFEPVFKAEYKRKRKLMDADKEKPDHIDEMGDKWKEYIITHPGLNIYKNITGKELEDSPYHGAQAEDIDYFIRVKMQAIATQYVDHAISSTINLPNDIPIDVVDQLYINAWQDGCKGLTIYRAGSRDGVLTEITSTRHCEDCDEASKELVALIEKGQRPRQIIPASAPKRPQTLECDIHRSKVGGGDWLFFVGKLNGRPYEVFGGDGEEFEIPHKYREGWIIKNGKIDGISQYNLVLGSLEDENEKLEFKGITKHFNNYEYGAFTRLTSLTIRHGTPIKYVCEQITKKGVEGDLFSFQRAMSRVLKKYISEGEKSESECPMCRSTDVVYKNGCPTCQLCGHSNCA
jgi:ribonucleotide reductase alpha subunit